MADRRSGVDWEGLDAPAKLAMRWAWAAALVRTGATSPDGAPVNSFDLFAGTLLADPQGSPARELLDHFNIPAGAVLRGNGAQPSVDALLRAIKRVPDGQLPPVDTETTTVLLRSGPWVPSDGLISLRELFGVFLMQTRLPACRALYEQLTARGVDAHQLVAIYDHYLAGRVPFTEFLRERLPRQPAVVELPPYVPDHQPHVATPDELPDLIGIRAEVDAFAYLTASKRLTPPLAVGLFGAWGAGKSYYLRSLRDRIDEVARDAATQDGDAPFHRHIVQIEFNAWQYVGGDLWASLLEHLFRNLRRSSDENDELVAQRQRYWVGKIQHTKAEQDVAAQLAQQRRSVRANRRRYWAVVGLLLLLPVAAAVVMQFVDIAPLIAVTATITAFLGAAAGYLRLGTGLMAKLKESEARERQLAVSTPRRVLSEFITDRINSDDYRSHLGVPALVRRDLERLSQLVAAHRDNPDDDPTPDEYAIDRIVLYIDDLDRCPTELVVKVLEAVHLLLAFPLFVVVVAVDSRWLASSLRENYPQLSGQDAVPEDYLEKIFQVPFWVRPLGTDVRQQMLRGLLEPNLDGQPADPVAADTADAGQDSLPGDLTEFRRMVESFAVTDRRERIRRAAANLTVTPDEMRAIEDVVDLIGSTPRAVKRFVNIYLLVKSIGLSNGWELPADGQLAVLLAVATGAPTAADRSAYPDVDRTGLDDWIGLIGRFRFTGQSGEAGVGGS